MKKLATVWIIALTLAISSFARAGATLGSTLRLPAYFQERYGDKALEVHVDAKAREASLKLRQERFTNPHGMTSSWPERYVFVVPSTVPESSRAKILAEKFLELMRTQDSGYRNSTASLEQMGIISADRKSHDLKLAKRFEDYGVSRLLGRTPADDDIAQLWWDLKFSEKNHEVPNHIQKGDAVLLSVRQYGYFEKSSSMLTTLRRKLDFGHATLALRHVGDGPENDFLINPGSKNLELSEVTLPNSVDPNVPNAVDVANFWVWSEVQLYQRYMKVAVRVLVLNDMQKRAVEKLVPGVKGVNFGPALAFSNNCADGVTRLVNFLLPVEKTFDSKGFLGISIPTAVQRKAANHFEDASSKLFKFPDISGENPNPETPGTSYKDAHFDDLSALKSFKDFREWEDRWVADFNASH